MQKKTQGSLNSSPNRAKYKKLLGLSLVAFVFFTFGYRAQALSLPGWLRGSDSSSVRVSQDVSVNVEEIYSKLREKFDGDIESDKVELGIKRGLVSAGGDPYTTFFTKDEYGQFQSSLNGSFSGIGAELGMKGEQLVVIAPIDDSPALKAGIKPGDAILSINGESTEGMSVDIAASKIRGEAGTRVKLKVSQNGDVKEIEITRGQVKVDSVKYEKVANEVGYIKISQFSTDTASLTEKAVKDLTSQGVTKFVLDLRNNGGGYVDSAINVAGIWMDSRVVLSERFRGKEVSVKRTASNPLLDLSKTKLVVLVNEGSASASEILAASLNENQGVQLVGQKTFGKGSVQDIIELGDQSRLKITIAHWFTPNGKTIDKIGIEPTVEVEQGDTEQDLQKLKAIELVSS